MLKGIVSGLVCVALCIAAAERSGPLESDIVKTLNQLRSDPAAYAGILKQWRPWYKGKVLAPPGQPVVNTQEGIHPLNEAIAALQSTPSGLGDVVISPALSRAAADHVADTGRRGITSHTGTDGSDITRRISRYGTWSGVVGEDISYGPREARSVIASLLIDDGVPNRDHRRSLLNPQWRYVGIACGKHAVYGTMCVMDFASGFSPRP
jgi:uncharacterized protein YkwD